MERAVSYGGGDGSIRFYGAEGGERQRQMERDGERQSGLVREEQREVQIRRTCAGIENERVAERELEREWA